jgi:hypothetical protein
MSKKRAPDVPLHKLDTKNTMRVEDDGDDDPRASEDDGRFGPPVIAGFGIPKADAAVMANRKIVKGKRTVPTIDVTLSGPRNAPGAASSPASPPRKIRCCACRGG